MGRLRSALVRRFGKDILAEVASEAAADALVEAHAGAGIDPDEHLWRSLTRQETRSLPKVTHERAIEVCYTLHQQNPLGHRITELNRDFVVGDGITWTARNPEVEEVVREFWDDDQNKLDLRLTDFALELGLYGELCLEAFVGEHSGVVQLGYIDPARIEDVLHVEGNPLALDKVILKRKGRKKPDPLEIIRPRQDGEGELPKLDGQVFFFKVNSVSNSPRGWPDLLHIADWLDAYDQLLWEMLERARLIRIFIWDVTLNGFDQTKIDAWVRAHGAAPKSGSIRAHNQEQSWQAVAPELGSFETAKEAEVLLEHIAAGAGFPKHWLSSAEDVNRATALEMASPTVRRLSQRQRYFTSAVREILRFVLDKAIASGALTTKDGKVPAYDEDGNVTEEMHEPIDLVQVHGPEISPKDVVAAGQLFVNAANALAVAETQGWLGKDPIRQVVAVVLAMLGYDYDPSAGPSDEKAEEEPGETEQEPPSRAAVEEAVRALGAA